MATTEPKTVAHAGDDMGIHAHPERHASIDGIEVFEKGELTVEERRLAEMGYAQAFQREFSLLSAFSFALSISGVYATVATTLSFPLYAGGPASAVWCWLISGGFCMCIALSVAELSSAYPTSGALYFSCKYLVPDKYIAEVGWVCGWLNLLGQIAGTASTDYGAAQLLLAAVSIGSDFTYFPTPGHTVAVSIAILTFHGLVNTASTKWLERITRYYVFYHIGVLVACCITLLALQKDKHSGRYVFTDVEPDSGWNPVGFSFLFGFLSASWTMTDYDATAHIAEEIKDAAVKMPWAISSALGFTYVAGWLFTIVLCFCMGDLSDILASPIGQPVAQVFYNVMGKSVSIFFIVSAVIVLTFTSNAGIQAGSRTMWAFARDEMLPLSRVWYKMNAFTGTPLNAVWCYTLICILINLIGLGSYTAVSAIFNVCAIAMDWSYCIPILAKLIWDRMEPGPWNLGPASSIINICAVSWTAFVSIIFMFPTFMPVTKDNMNYASVIFVGIALFALAYWYLAGRRYYTGPRTRIMVIDGMVEPDQSEAAR